MFTTTHHPSAVAAPIGAGGFVGLFNTAPSAPSDVVSITPLRVLDTRDPNNVGLAGPFVSATEQDLTVRGDTSIAYGPQQVVPPGAPRCCWT